MLRPAAVVSSAGGSTRTPGRDARVGLAFLIAVLVTVSGLHVLLRGVGWWFALAGLSILLIGVAALVRYFARGRRYLLPTLASSIVLLLVLTVFFVPTTALAGIVPTGGSFAAFGRLVQAATRSIDRQSVPATADLPILFLLCFGVGAIVIVGDAIAVSFRAPAFAGIPLVVLLAVPSAVAVGLTDPLVFVLAALAFLLLLWVGSTRRQWRVSAFLAVVVVAASLLAPLALPAVEESDDSGGSGSFSMGVNPVLTLGQDLRRDEEHTVLDYSTSSGEASYLRLVSVDNFTGTNWAPDRFDVDTRNTTDRIGDPPGLSPDVETSTDTTYVNVGPLTSTWLPLPYPTTRVDGLTGTWYWDRNGLAVKSTDRTSFDEEYRARNLVISPTPEQLAAAGTTVPNDMQRFLALPANLPKIISTTATEVAGGASSNYEKALLLQNYFRDGTFEYSETAPVENGYDGTGMRVIARFLQEKEGYCIHFASAMAVMARSLGIPSRVAVGFLPGATLPETDHGRTLYEVTSHDLHAWPELYFEGIGWTRFEPTASRGIVPSYADQSSADVPVPVNTPLPSAGASAAPQPTSSATSAPSDSPDAGGAAASTAPVVGPVGWLLIAVLIVLLVLLVPAFLRGLRRSGRLRALAVGSAGAGVAWAEVLQTAEDLGVPVPPTQTPRDTVGLLAGGRFAEDPALGRLLDAVERESFARPGAVGSYPGIADDTRSVLAALRSSAEGPDRLWATLRPRSVWRRILHPFGTEA
ncbi:MAG TPA: transglutaminaseTgpA domain-containing protein [Lacisediminihabitans sp.]|uniref:transglutaminase TgpA family protein n=1 Tax=Lacisediminihabitans sp. TaxID=2787631 RepID=UPI002ED88EBB